MVVSLAAFSAHAAEETVRIDRATIHFDPARWTVTSDRESATFEAKGEAVKDLDPVDFRHLSDVGAKSCAEVSLREFGVGRYDETSIERSETTIGGVAAERFTAHTRCRNATPRGEVVCIRTGGAVYVLAALQAGCGGRNLFSGIDPLVEIAGGVSFTR